MALLVVRNLEDDVKARLQRRARRHRRSTAEEAEAREMLRNAVKGESVPRKPLGSRLQERFAGIGLQDEVPEWRGEVAQPATFGNKSASVG